MNFGFIFHMRYIFVTHFLSAKYVKNDLRKHSNGGICKEKDRMS